MQTRVLRLDHAPDLAAVAATHPDSYPFLLDSAASGPLGHWSLLLRHGGEKIVLSESGHCTGAGEGGFFDRLDSAFEEARHDTPEAYAHLPFLGGWFLYLAYEAAGDIEPVLDLPAAGDGLPAALAARCEGAILLRHDAPGGAWLVAEEPGLLDTMQAELANLDEEPACKAIVRELVADPAPQFEASVERIHEYILAGDVFQVNLSRGWKGQFSQPVDPTALYRRLCEANPAPFAGLMRWDDRALLSSSPERLVEIREGLVQTRPIAGTHPRGRDAESDRALANRMLAHPKERAEHIMLIDLERNDLGRVCHPGSVEVDELMVLETYAHVHHIVSNVRGRLREDVGPGEVIRAVFPGGTITGCPKVRCMQIIAELEGGGRGFYTGSMGYLDHRGHMDLNILIRSMLVDGAEFRFRTGAGIVADSQPAAEVAETEHKARGLLAALGAGARLQAVVA